MPRRLRFERLSLFQQPLLFIALSFICGLLLAARYQVSIGAWIAIAAISWVTSATLLSCKRGDWIIVVSLLCGCLAAGGAIWEIDRNNVARDRVLRLFELSELKVDEPVEIRGVLNKSPELAPDRIYLSVRVEKLATFGRERPASGCVQLVVPFMDRQARVEYDALRLDYGTRVRALCNLSNRHNYRNPGAPDFDEMLEHRGFDATGWIKSPLLIEPLIEGEGNRFLAKLYQLRAHGLTVILRSFRQPAAGILAAALLGNRYFLARETAEAFRAGGTFHLLVISGLHVALIAMAMIRFASYLSHSRFIQYSFVLAFIWGYALMVGMEPSIARAVVMLSIVLIGKVIFREAAGANTMAASAIVLLSVNPRDIFNPAFQLSFLTVLIIVVFIAPLYQRLKAIGSWQPSLMTPYPPRVSRPVKWLSEALYWNEEKFREEMNESRIRFKLNKVRFSLWLNEMRLQRIINWIVVTISTTTGVQMALLPLMVALFHRVSIVGPLANVIEGILIFVLMIAGAIYLAIHALSGGIAIKLAGLVNELGVMAVKLNEPLPGRNFASFRVPDFGESSAAIFTPYFFAVTVLIIVTNEWNPLRKGDDSKEEKAGRLLWVMAQVSLLTIVILGWLIIAHPLTHEYDRGRLSVTFLDVGQGDSLVVTFPSGSLMMIDAGGRPAYQARGDPEEEDEDLFIEDRIGIAEAAVMPYLWRRGMKRLDWIVGIHQDADHVDGFTEIARSFSLGSALKSERGQLSPGIFDQAIKHAQLPLRMVKRGDQMEIEGVRIAVLSPYGNEQDNGMTVNDRSLVLKMTFGVHSFLLTGDLEKEGEMRLVESPTDLQADVLKVAHHGSRTSSTHRFLEKVKPRHAVISAGDPSPYGHPHPEVVARLQAIGAQVWRTGSCGAITISTDGHRLNVETFVKCE